MSAALALLRPDLRGFVGYASARRAGVDGAVWLNANESPQPSPAARPGQALNRYPEPQPRALRARLAQLYGVREEQLMVTRGSDEGIDLLVRAFCRAGRDGVGVATPCFGMYAACARVQDAPLVELPLLDRDGRWDLDVAGVLAAVDAGAMRVLFLSSPANPTGQALALEDIRALATAIAGRAVLVIDEAYLEYGQAESAASLLDEFDCLVVLRTLSKAHALAGARIGATLASAELIAVLRNLSAPYPVAAPSANLALQALSPAALAETRRRCAALVEQREHVAWKLAMLPGVSRVYPSQGNFLLVRLDDPQAALARLLAAGVVVRDMRALPRLADALRISIGTAAENRCLLDALGSGAVA